MNKYINLNSEDRFIKTSLLRASYVNYEESLNPTAINYVPLENGLELGIVSSQVPEISKAISSILSRSLEDGKYTKGGYLPPDVVERVQLNIISPFGISEVWGTTGHRFVLSQPSGDGMREIIASILVGRSKDTIFFFTGRYNNIKHSEIKQTIDLDLPSDSDPNHKWSEQFAFPKLERFKPAFYHHIANFVVDKAHREQGIARLFLHNIRKYYSRNYLNSQNIGPQHSQHLLCGYGFWQIGDPPWLPKMKRLGFYLRGGAENFFIEHNWAKLPKILDENGKVISNVEYNKSFGLPEMYDNFVPTKTEEHLMHRIPEVINLSKNPRAKLQYFQAMYDFL